MAYSKDWRVIKSESVRKGRFEIVYETVQFTPDYSGPFSYVHNRADGVCILPVIDNKQICLVSLYRRPVDAMEIEVPAGMIDVEESPSQAASRELLEETGYRASRWINCGFIYSSPGSSTEKMYLYVALCTENSAKERHLDQAEDISLQSYSFAQVRDMIRNGKIHHSATQVLFYQYIERERDGNL